MWWQTPFLFACIEAYKNPSLEVHRNEHRFSGVLHPRRPRGHNRPRSTRYESFRSLGSGAMHLTQMCSLLARREVGRILTVWWQTSVCLPPDKAVCLICGIQECVPKSSVPQVRQTKTNPARCVPQYRQTARTPISCVPVMRHTSEFH